MSGTRKYTKPEGQAFSTESDILLKLHDAGDTRYQAHRPPADLYETDDGVVVNIELPGVREQDLEVQLTGDVLTIRGRRRDHCPREKKSYRIMEIHHGTVERILQLPCQVDGHNGSANLEDGVLELFFPRATRSKRNSTQAILLEWEVLRRR